MRLVCLVVVFFHRQACLLGGQTTNRIFNYAADIPVALGHRRKEERMYFPVNVAGSDDLARVIDSVCTCQIPTGLGANQFVQTVHGSFQIYESSIVSRAIFAGTDDLIEIVNVVGVTNRKSGQSSQVRHHSIAVNERMLSLQIRRFSVSHYVA